MSTQTIEVVEPSRTRQTPSEQVSGETSRNVDVERVKDARPWVVLAASFAVIFVGVGYTNTFGVFEEYYQTVLFPDQPPSKLLLIGSTASSLYLILGAFTGRFADLVGYQASLTVGALFMVGSLVAASFARAEYYQYLLSQGVLFGLGVAFAYYPAVSIPRQYFGAARHGLASGIVVSGGALGGCVLPYVVRVSLDRHGLPATFRLLACLAAGLLVPSIPLLKPPRKMDNRQEQPPSRAGQTTTTTQQQQQQQQQKKKTPPPLLDLSLLRDRRYVVLLAATTVAMVGFLPRYFFTPVSASARGVSGSYSVWLLGLMNGLSIVGRVGIGSFADRWGKVLALAVSFVMCGLGHLLFWLPAVLVPSEGTATALFTLFVVHVGLLGSGFISLIPVVVAHLFGADDLASKMGLLNSAVGLGVLAGPSAVYGIVAADSWSVGVVVSGGLMVAGGLAVSGIFRYT